jgi:GTP1/Obg family GTP-binding protein
MVKANQDGGAWGLPQQVRTWISRSMLALPEIAHFLCAKKISKRNFQEEQMNTEESEKLNKERSGVFVRLNEDQKIRLERESFISGWSMPSLLRDSFFKRLPVKLLFGHEETKKVLAELRRIGNNVNQLAKHANQGERVNDLAFKSVQEQFQTLYSYLMGIDGIHKNHST